MKATLTITPRELVALLDEALKIRGVKMQYLTVENPGTVGGSVVSISRTYSPTGMGASTVTVVPTGGTTITWTEK